MIMLSDGSILGVLNFSGCSVLGVLNVISDLSVTVSVSTFMLSFLLEVLGIGDSGFCFSLVGLLALSKEINPGNVLGLCSLPDVRLCRCVHVAAAGSCATSSLFAAASTFSAASILFTFLFLDYLSIYLWGLGEVYTC